MYLIFKQMIFLIVVRHQFIENKGSLPGVTSHMGHARARRKTPNDVPWEMLSRRPGRPISVYPWHWSGYLQGTWVSTSRGFSLADHTLPTHPEPPWQNIAQPPLHGTTQRGGKPKFNHGQSTAHRKFLSGSLIGSEPNIPVVVSIPATLALDFSLEQPPSSRYPMPEQSVSRLVEAPNWSAHSPSREVQT